MRQLLHIAAFWLVVFVAIRVAVCFPRSFLARVLFLPLGPVGIRGESPADYLSRGRLGRAPAHDAAGAAIV